MCDMCRRALRSQSTSMRTHVLFECIRGLCGRPRAVPVPCPLCRTHFHVHKLGLNDLLKNHLAEQLKDVVEAEQSQSVVDDSDVHCEVCSTRKEAATMFCTDCRQRMCDVCADVHKRLSIARSHDLFKISNYADVDELAGKVTSKYCAKHQDEVLKWYCLTCNVTTCDSCFIELHKSHDHSDVMTVTDVTRNQIDEDIKMIEETIAAYDVIIQEQKMNEEALSKRIAIVKREVHDHAELLKQRIEQEKQLILQVLDCNERSILDQLKQTVNEVVQHRSHTKSSFVYAETLMKKGTAWEVMKNASRSRDKAVDDMSKLKLIQKKIPIHDSGSTIVTFTPSTPALWTVGEVHMTSDHFEDKIDPGTLQDEEDFEAEDDAHCQNVEIEDTCDETSEDETDDNDEQG